MAQFSSASLPPVGASRGIRASTLDAAGCIMELVTSKAMVEVAPCSAMALTVVVTPADSGL